MYLHRVWVLLSGFLTKYEEFTCVVFLRTHEEALASVFMPLASVFFLASVFLGCSSLFKLSDLLGRTSFLNVGVLGLEASDSAAASWVHRSTMESARRQISAKHNGKNKSNHMQTQNIKWDSLTLVRMLGLPSTLPQPGYGLPNFCSLYQSYRHRKPKTKIQSQL